MPGGRGQRGVPLLAALALVLCCALPALLIAGGGAAAAIAGGALGFWPLVLAGLVVLGWGAVRLAAVRRSRLRSRSGGASSRSRPPQP